MKRRVLTKWSMAGNTLKRMGKRNGSTMNFHPQQVWVKSLEAFSTEKQVWVKSLKAFSQEKQVWVKILEAFSKERQVWMKNLKVLSQEKQV